MKERTDQQDRNDLVVLARAYLLITSCPGGRIVVKGYMCPHCGCDPSMGECKGVKPHIKAKAKGGT